MTPRILIAVTHLLGAGHLTRAAAIGRALARAGCEVTLASGGAPSPLVDLGGLRLVQLPPVRAAVGDFRTLLDPDGRPATPERLSSRRALLLAALAEARPDVVVTELFPFGRRSLAAELGALVEAAWASRPRPLVLASVRDVLAPPSTPEKAAAAHALVSARYDGVLVHGAEAVIPLDASWPVDAALRRKLAYTGYVADQDADEDADGREEGDEVLVSGGSSAASLPLYEAALGAAALRPDRPWRLLVGGGVDAASFAGLRDAAPPNAPVERARPDFRGLLRRARAFVGQAGYNTVLDLAAARARAVLVPFERGRETEQRLRAERLASLGLAAVLPEAELSPARLLAAVEEVSGRPRPPANVLPAEGAAETARLVVAMARAPRAGLGTSRP